MVHTSEGSGFHLGKRAIVIGGSISGLSAAAALAGYFDEVLVLERDELQSSATPRAGVPQGRQAHGILGGALKALEELFPGFAKDLQLAGAVPVNPGFDVLLEIPGLEPFPRGKWDWLIYSATRPLIEFTVRRRVEQFKNIQLRDGHRALNLVGAANGSVVYGVQCKTSEEALETLSADLVIDASGDGVPTLSFLKSTGHSLPRETRIGVDIRYATALFSAPNLPDYKALVTYPKAPESVRAGYLLPAENDAWQLLLIGRGEDAPSADGDEFLAFAQQLWTTSIYEATKSAQRISEVARFAFPASVWRHFGDFDMPAGLLPIGDAICRLNPVYGQGMTTALQEAAILRSLLERESRQRDSLASVARAFLEETELLLDGPWSMSAIPDFVYPQTQGTRPDDLESTLKFQGALNRLAVRDLEIWQLLGEVRHLVRPSSALKDPELVRQVEEEMATA
jgi:2-polyprenyl-6-methoxyphenol hydroxylase-like FAD-dependent oxidoreductase